MSASVWIYQVLACILVIFVNIGCFQNPRRQSLQMYEKSESYMLLCTDCSQTPLIQKSRSQEHCARKCKMKNFSCRAFNYQRQLKKCHLLPFDRFTHGVQKQANINFTLYEKKEYVRECISGTKDNYRGRRSWTKSNITCQAWSDNNINEHTFNPDRYRMQDLRENFCRNPNNDPGGPWCYTTDPNVRSEECGIPQCSQDVCMRCNGEDYRGKVDQTESGKECQRWDSKWPHAHQFQPKKYRNKDLRDNYCRNPNNRLRPWCYTMDPRTPWEYCSITVCDSEPSEDTDVNTTLSCIQGDGKNYRGTMNITPEGVTCQRWDSQFPHNHSFLPINFKCKDLRENYCRNPDGADYPWCFTTDPNQRIAKCTHISRCDAEAMAKIECYEDNGEMYRGTLSTTRSGIPCADWSPHINSGDSHSTISHVGLERNHCRNPDRDKHGPWCYTSPNNRLVWDYCKLKQCGSVTVAPQPNNLTRPKISCFVHINTRIVGGHEVRGTDGSWVVSIQREKVHLCGGSLIREDWVLTDQQCFTSCVPALKDYSVQVGLRHLNESSRRPRLRISRLICGPEGSNLVMLKLEVPAPVSEGASTIHLPVKECHITEGTNCTMYGWGETKNTGLDEALNSVTMPMVDNDMCSKIKGDTKESRICAGGKIGEGVCDRDYGGPLVCQEHERKVIIGVSIQRTKCASSQPALFVNVAFYSEWIYKVFKLYPSLERN
ncbi:hepatocyte growth factor a isoform X2 [Girardinichthys multiradiatus]|uniref:hepatocyte growth factor a isoform X2 n=1 Tax=Girardinichthys multiradiatus TaxID=208333 RepID=UPI001FAD6472|nr:hepatocyte growth factor a isoform X2 [Girardinichthys multiradiatus]